MRAGWLEGGLTASKEKFILDVEVLQMIRRDVPAADRRRRGDRSRRRSQRPLRGGHFFGGEHTLARYRTAFYEPLVSDWANYGQWTEAGSLDATAAGERDMEAGSGGVRAAAARRDRSPPNWPNSSPGVPPRVEHCRSPRTRATRRAAFVDLALLTLPARPPSSPPSGACRSSGRERTRSARRSRGRR